MTAVTLDTNCTKGRTTSPRLESHLCYTLINLLDKAATPERYFFFATHSSIYRTTPQHHKVLFSLLLAPCTTKHTVLLFLIPMYCMSSLTVPRTVISLEQISRVLWPFVWRVLRLELIIVLPTSNRLHCAHKRWSAEGEVGGGGVWGRE